MKSCIIFVFLMVSITFCQNLADEGKLKSHSLFFAIPESDTIYTVSSRHALSASTTPGSKVSVNGKDFKVYPSGAFAGLLEIAEGVNHFQVTSISPSGIFAKKELVFVRRKQDLTPFSDSLYIEDAGMEPSRDLWLFEGDILNVRIKGTPNCRVTFFNNLEMTELPLSETRGIQGIYQGTFRVRTEDKLLDTPVTFRMESRDGRLITKNSRGKVSFLTDGCPVVGRTKGERPYLNYGLGEDRLGGAKISFLNAGIKLRIAGKSGNQYKVMLSDNQKAWIPEDQIELLPKGTFLPNSLTSSWNVYGDNKYDYISVGLNDRLPYTTLQDPANKRIIVDIHGAVSNTNWIIQHRTTKEIKNVYYEVPSEGLFRIVIELKHKQIWGYGINYAGNNLIIKVKHQPEDLDIEDLTFILDAGHGGANLGALGATGAREKDINLSTVNHLKNMLEDEGAKVILTRIDDTYSTNAERIKTIMDSDADILVSIHSNSIGYSSDPEKVKGISTYYKHICFRPLSTFIYDEVLKTGLDPFGNIGNFNFALNSPTEIPNVLIELGFMSNPEDEMKLMDDKFRKELAEKIMCGIEEFLDNCED